MKPTEPSLNPPESDSVSIADFQRLIRDMYYEKDVARGVPGTFMWLMEEVGELSTALRETSSAKVADMTPEEQFAVTTTCEWNLLTCWLGWQPLRTLLKLI